MKVMHLSDLHLGKSILEQSLIEDQKYILDKIIEIIKSKEVGDTIKFKILRNNKRYNEEKINRNYKRWINKVSKLCR